MTLYHLNELVIGVSPNDPLSKTKSFLAYACVRESVGTRDME